MPDAPEVAPSSAGPGGGRTFGPVVLLGGASSGAVAVAGNKALVAGSSGQVSTANPAFLPPAELEAATTAPLVTALALVVLASWGVLLVTRGHVRWALAWLAALASSALFVVTWSAGPQLSDRLAHLLLSTSGTDTVSTHITGWYAAALVAGALAIVAGVLAVRWARGWPEMGSRYDAPAAPAGGSDEPRSNLDIWKALDEGRDPTA